ncbi:MAG: Ldh family oxidoreductase [Eubacterium sp.]|nr:Ldh family oxidoreductase [Eubacterium sp.]
MKTVDAKKIESLVKQIFMAEGLTEDDSAILATVLVDANLTGRASHGVLRVSSYVRRLRAGGAKKNPQMKIIKETPLSAIIDADNSLGMLSAYKTAKYVREKAEKNGMAVVSLTNNCHFGTGFYWNRMIGRDDMITMNVTNTPPLMVPPGGKKPMVGTNPVGIYVTSESYGPLMLDVATSQVAQGRLVDYSLKHQPIPDGWAVDKDGHPTNDPDAAVFLMPFGGHKGYGFAVMVDVFCGLLAGAETGYGVKDINDYASISHVTQTFFAMRIDLFRDPAEFRRDVDKYIEYLKSTPTVEGQTVYYPGELEKINAEKARREGMQLPEDLIDELAGFAREGNIPDIESYFEI